MKKLLKNWLNCLDRQIGDTEEAIEERRQSNIAAVKVRDDLYDLIEYLETNELPDSVKRAIEGCLKWNPYANKEPK